MSRSNQRRRRPGRRPPDRLAYRYRNPPAAGFTAGPFGPYYRWLLPGLRGAEQRAFFNRITLGPVAGIALGSAAAGYQGLGVLGGAVGLAAGAALGAAFVARERFFRT